MNQNEIVGFVEAGRSVLSFLRERLGFDLWMITRTEGEDWIVLQSEDHGYGVAPGMVFRWADSFCSQMVRGNGPRVAPRSDCVPLYAVAEIGKQVQIKAYIGTPIVYEDGRLFGTLCAIHPEPRPDSIVGEQALVELMAKLLGSILNAELAATAARRQSERLLHETITDPLTGLHNRRGWERLMSAEEERCRAFGHPAAVAVVDLNELKRVNDSQGHAAGDALIRRTAAVLREAAGTRDIVARLGGDEFGILGPECNRQQAENLLHRIRERLAAASIEAATGLAMRKPLLGLVQAWETADQRMYARKRATRQDSLAR